MTQNSASQHPGRPSLEQRYYCPAGIFVYRASQGCRRECDPEIPFPDLKPEA